MKPLTKEQAMAKLSDTECINLINRNMHKDIHDITKEFFALGYLRCQEDHGLADQPPQCPTCGTQMSYYNCTIAGEMVRGWTCDKCN